MVAAAMLLRSKNPSGPRLMSDPASFLNVRLFMKSLSPILGLLVACSPGEIPIEMTEHGLLSDVRDFGSNPGELHMRKYVPDSMPQNAPVVFAFHACSQITEQPPPYYNAWIHAGWTELADEWGFYVVYPAQDSANNGINCFNWAGEYGDPTNLMRGEGENESIHQMLQKMEADHSIDPSRVYMAGFSGGGAMVSLMMATWPELFAGGAIMAGIPYYCTTTFTEVSTCLSPGIDRTPSDWGDRVRNAYPGYSGPYPLVSIWQGANDTNVATRNQTELIEQWTDVHGIDQTPDGSDMIDGHPHEVFKNASGQTVVESYRVANMPHGTPYQPSSGCGSAVPGGKQGGSYFYDVGICAARRIGEYFGLDGGGMPVDRNPPDISITAPNDGAAVTSNVEIRATASDDVGVVEVIISINGTPKATLTQPPYTYVWNTATEANGSYTLTAEASDAAGNRSKMDIAVTVTGGVDDNTPPTVNVTAPANGDTISGTFTISVDASDDFGVAKVEVRIDGAAIGEATAQPYSVAFDTSIVAAGSHAISAVAFDAAGNTATDDDTTVTISASDTNKPTVKITSPSDGAMLSGVVRIQVDASDDVGIQSVLMFLDDVQIGTDYRGPGYEFLWDTAVFPQGTHELRARAFDRAGNLVDDAIAVSVSQDAETPEEGKRVLVGRRYWGCDSMPGEPSALILIFGLLFLFRRRKKIAVAALLFGCGAPIYDTETPTVGLSTPARVSEFLDGKKLVMEGSMIPTHPNGYDQNMDFGAATQCYHKVTMTPLGGKIRVSSELGTRSDDSGCDRMRVSGEASFDSTAVLIENVEGDASCFDFTITYPGFGQEGRGEIDAERTTLTLELFFKDQAIGHRCADGGVGDPTVTLNQTMFTGDAQQRYQIGE
jgi:poly(hydroxyalkanoate) depolymerase family esterase